MTEHNTQNTNKTPAGIAELLYLDMAYQLGSRLIQKDQKLTLKGLKESIKLIPAFNMYFAPAYSKDDGSIEWPVGDKKGIVEPTFSTIEEKVQRITETAAYTAPSFMKDAGIKVYAEREGRDPAYPCRPSGDIEGLDVLTPLVAARVAYLYGRIRSQLFNAGHRLASKSNMMPYDMHDLYESECYMVDSDEGYTPDSEITIETDDDAGWGIEAAISAPKNSGVYALQPVEFDSIEPWMRAFKRWYEWLEALPSGASALTDELEFQRERAREYVESNKKNAPITGVKKAA